MSRAPVLTLLIAVAAIVAAPVSLHFEGNAGTLDPFRVVFPFAALVAGAGAAIALRLRIVGLLVLNVLAAAAAILFWVGLLSYQGD